MRKKMGFSAWFPLTEEGVAQHAPLGAAAVQVRRAEGLVTYPQGKSAMVYYFFASQNAADALREIFADEIEAPGQRGQGPLRYRVWDEDAARPALEELFMAFEERFGAPPIFT